MSAFRFDSLGAFLKPMSADLDLAAWEVTEAGAELALGVAGAFFTGCAVFFALLSLAFFPSIKSPMESLKSGNFWISGNARRSSLAN